MEYNTVIIGGGVAGLTAGLYLGRANKKCLILEAKFWGGQTALLSKVDNYPALAGVAGFDITNSLINQVKSYSTEFKNEQVIKLTKVKSCFKVITNKGEYLASNIIIATGAKTGVLGLDNEKRLLGRGVSYCATCDGNFFKNKRVAVFGVGKTAIEDVKYLDNLVEKLYWIIPDDNLYKKNNEVNGLKRLEIIYSSEISELVGTDILQAIKIYDKANKKEFSLEVEGLFVSLGRQPDTSWLNIKLQKDNAGYIIVDKNCETSCKGIFACGDIISRDLKQIITACSDGAIASNHIIQNN